MWWLLLGCTPADVRPGEFDVVAAQWIDGDADCGLVADGFPFAFSSFTLADPRDGTFTLALSTVSSDPLACRLGPVDDLGDPTYTCLSATFSWPQGEARVAVDWITEGSYDRDHSALGGGIRLGAICAEGDCSAPASEPFATLPCSSQGFWGAIRSSD